MYLSNPSQLLLYDDDCDDYVDDCADFLEQNDYENNILFATFSYLIFNPFDSVLSDFYFTTTLIIARIMILLDRTLAPFFWQIRHIPERDVK